MTTSESALPKIIFCVLYLTVISIAYGQIKPPSGPYTSSDGMYTVNMEFKNNTLVIIEPNKTSVYVLTGDNMYEYINPDNGKHYKMQVGDETTLIAFGSTGSTNFYFSGGLSKAASKEQFAFYQKVAEEYKNKMKEDPDDAQMWALCAAAATNRASLNDEGFEEYARATILSLRQIVTDQRTCPCPRAIPPALWGKVK